MGGPFIAPRGNLPIAVLGTRTCPNWEPDMSTKAYSNPAMALVMSSAGT
jgi:hypothetical protein